MPQLTSPLSTPAGMAGVNPAHVGKMAGTRLHFPTFAAWTAAITSGATGFSSDLWADGQEMTIADEADTGAVRVWRSSLGHARTVRVGGASFVLAANTNVVTATSGAPSSGGANGDVAVDGAAGVYYVRAAGSWGTASALYPAPGAVNVAAPRVPPTPVVLAGNGRIYVYRPAGCPEDYAGYVASISGGAPVVCDPTKQLVALPAPNGGSATVRVAFTVDGVQGPWSAQSRAITPTSIAGLGDIGIDPRVIFVPDFAGLANGASVAQLDDLSGNGFHAVQATGANQPTIVTGAANGRSALNGSGSQHLVFDDRLDMFGGSFVDISIWSLNTASPSDSRYYSNFQGGTTEREYIQVDANGTSVQANPVFRVLNTYSSGGTIGGTSTAVAMISLSFPGPARVNGALQSIVGGTCGSMKAVRKSTQIFGYAGANKRLNGRMYAFSRWPASITASQRQAVEAWLAGLFGITVTQS